MKSACVIALFALALAPVPVSSASAVRVFPSGPTVPQALLRITLTFADAQAETIASQLRIRQDGSDAYHPFADVSIWSPDHRMLTLLLDPSRQKIGLANHHSFGFVLRAHRRAELRLRGRLLKVWFVEDGACAPLDPARWSARPVRVGTRDTLTVRLSAPIDALSEAYIAIAGPQKTRAHGRTNLSAGERVWSFSPAAPWQIGDVIAIHPRLEDPCGNEIGEPFEHVAGTGLDERRVTTFLPLVFVTRKHDEALQLHG